MIIIKFICVNMENWMNKISRKIVIDFHDERKVIQKPFQTTWMNTDDTSDKIKMEYIGWCFRNIFHWKFYRKK